MAEGGRPGRREYCLHPPRAGVRRALLALLLCAALLELWRYAPLRAGTTAGHYALTLLSQAVCVGCPAALSLFRDECLRAQVRGAFSLPRRGRARALWLTAACALLCYPAAYAVTFYWNVLLRMLGVAPDAAAMPLPAFHDAAGLALALTAAALVPALLEETLMRGVVLCGLQSGLPQTAALCVTSVAFAALHRSLSGLPALLMVSFLLGAVMLRWRSLALCALLHALYNAAALLSEYLPQGALRPVMSAAAIPLLAAAATALLWPERSDGDGASDPGL